MCKSWPKGFGSENMSRIFMLKPADGIEGVKKAILETVEAAGPNVQSSFRKCLFFLLMLQDSFYMPVHVAAYIDGYRKTGYVRRVCFNIEPNCHTGDNTPGIIHYEIVPGDQLEITNCPSIWLPISDSSFSRAVRIAFLTSGDNLTLTAIHIFPV